ncbi:MAG: hypothetical protein WA376_07620 [Terrimicrobiaceae bacterium]
MDERRICLVCGTKFPAKRGFCPVCILREILADGSESGEPPAESTEESLSRDTPARLEHFELVRDEDGRPVELGRGAMGVTYKVLDVDLHCLVTLKVANRTDIEEALREPVDIAELQKSISLARRAEATYAEYGRQQAGA